MQEGWGFWGVGCRCGRMWRRCRGCGGFEKFADGGGPRGMADELGARVTTAEEAVSGADVVLTLTSSPVPILQGRWLKKDAVVCAVGAVTPDRRELDDEAMRGAGVAESPEGG